MQRIDRILRHLVSQDTARANAAKASARLRKRREEHEEVDAYLWARLRANRSAAAIRAT
jgi:hypothetical protein